jgi:hypothetical protein
LSATGLALAAEHLPTELPPRAVPTSRCVRWKSIQGRAGDASRQRKRPPVGGPFARFISAEHVQ